MSYQQRNLISRARQDRSSLHHSKSGLDLVTKRDRVRGSYMAAIRGLDLSLDNPLKLPRLREDNDACHISFSINRLFPQYSHDQHISDLQGGSHPLGKKERAGVIP